MKKIAAYILTFIFYVSFLMLILIFHPIQMISRKFGGYEGHKRSVEALNWFILKSLKIVGAKIKFAGFDQLPENRPLIIVSNHQSSWDIPPVVWGFRKHHPKFISKIELGKNIPSISYNLRHGGSALIDRKNGAQAIKELIKLGQRIEKNNYAACIFPEGTRSRTGKIRKFRAGGIKSLLKAAPSALIVPFAVDGNYKLVKNKYRMELGARLNYQVLTPIEPEGLSAEEIVKKSEDAIKSALHQE